MAPGAENARLPKLWDANLPYRFILVSDLDHTMVQNEDPNHEHLLQMNRLWCSGLGMSSALIYSTGRSPELYRELWSQAPLLTPQVLICSVGSEIFMLSEERGSNSLFPRLMYRPDASWEEHLSGDGWDRDKVLAIASSFPQLKQQAATEQRPHKLSFLLEAEAGPSTSDVLDRLSSALKAEGLPTKVIYSGGVDLDILPERAGKGRALEFILKCLKEKGHAWPELGVQVNGDSGNDIELFEVPGVQGCIVANAHPELRQFAEQHKHEPHLFQATKPCAGGILEALQHFGTTSQKQPQPQSPQQRLADAVGALVLQLGTFLAAATAGQAGAAAAHACSSAVPEPMLPESLSSAVPAGGLALHFGRGLQLMLEQQQQQPAPSVWVDVLEVKLPEDPEGSHAEAGTSTHAEAYFQVFRLLDGVRDVASSLTCTASLACSLSNGQPHVMIKDVSVSKSEAFVLPPTAN